MPWSVYEHGTTYLRVVEADLLGSERRMLQFFGEDQSDVNDALDMVNLPPKLVAAFPDPRAIRPSWVRGFKAHVERDPDRMRELLRIVAPPTSRTSATEVYATLKEIVDPDWKPPARRVTGRNSCGGRP